AYSSDAAKKTLVTLFANTSCESSAVASPGQSLILTQGPGNLSAVAMSQMLQPVQVIPTATPGASTTASQPIFIATQGFPVRNVRPVQNSVNPLGIVLNVQQGQTVRPITIVQAPGGQFFKPAVGVPQVLSQVTQVRPGTAVPGRPPTSTYTTMIPATLAIRTTTAAAASQPGAKTITTVTAASATQLVHSSALSSPTQTIAVPTSKIVNVCNLVAVQRGERNAEVQKLVNLVNTVSPAPLGQPPLLQVSMATSKAPSNGLVATVASSDGIKGTQHILGGGGPNILASERIPSRFLGLFVSTYICPELVDHSRLTLGDDPCPPGLCSVLSLDQAPQTQQARSSETGGTVRPPAADGQGGAADAQGKLIMLVDDFYYGSDEGRVRQVSREGKEPVPFKCLNCSKKLKNNIRFMNHMKHHVELDQQTGEVDTHTSCQHCYRQFPTPFQLQCHLESVHSHCESTTKCKICEWAFESEPVFLQHMKNTHKPGEMPYVCQVCDFRSSYYSEVDAHFRAQHEDTKNLLCLYCLKVFKNGSAFQQHFFRHQKKSVYHCNKCRLQFLFTKDKIEHKLHHHKTFRKPKQLEGLKPGTKVTIRAYAVQTKVAGAPKNAPALPPPAQPLEAESLPPKPADPPSGLSPAQKPAAKKKTVRFKKPPLGKQTCLECSFDIPDFPNHYPTYVHCSLCRYSTCCSRAYANHMINNHVPRKSPKYLALYKKPAPSWVKMACSSCSYQTNVGDLMAKHLVQHPSHSFSLCTLEGRQHCAKDSPVSKRECLHGVIVSWVYNPGSFPSAVWASKKLSSGSQPQVTHEPLPKAPADVKMPGAVNGKEPNSGTAPVVDPSTLGERGGAAGRVAGGEAGKGERAPEQGGDRPEAEAGEKERDGTLSVRQLRIVLFALCCGVPQAAEHFGSPPQLITTWMGSLEEKEKQREQEGKAGGARAAVDKLVAWVLGQREQQLPVNEKSLFQKASEIHSTANQNSSFRISYEWAVGFMLRHNLGLQARGAVGRRLPPDMEESVRAFVEFVQRQIRVQDIPLAVIGTMDELSVFVDLEALAGPGATGKEAAFQLVGTGESLFDVVVATLADGSILPTLIFFKGQPPSRVLASLPDSVLLEAKPEGFTEEEEVEIWISRVWQKHMDSQSGAKGMLVVDSFRSHMSEDSLAALSAANTLPAIIPAGCTSRVLPLEVCVGPALRSFLQAKWSSWASQAQEPGPGAEQVLQLLVGWVAEALGAVAAHPELLQQSFLVASVLPGPERVESVAETQAELVGLLERRLTGAEPTAGQAQGQQEPRLGGGPDLVPDPRALHHIFERDSDAESFHGFDDAELE
uniref:Pogo transposable element derived with ZNF domain a n=1 Tax=Lepisosteus oculatus TaxID=7918 RepID=W5MPQ3_LEPOC